MSVGKINELLNIWATSLVPHNDKPPFKDHSDLYSMINATPSPGGDVNWKSFTLCFAAEELPLDVPNWKKMKWDVWYRDPQELINNMLQNPDFHDKFDYIPHQEYDLNGNHHFHNVMSGDWCWHEMVSKYILFPFIYFVVTELYTRILLLKIQIQMILLRNFPCM